MFNRNKELKLAKRNIPNWAIAEKLGIHENTFYRWLRTEMIGRRKEIVMVAIEDVIKEMRKEGEK